MSVSISPSGKILIITFSYAPMQNPRAFRWTALAEFWAKQGISVEVICAWTPGQPAEETISGVRISRVGMKWAELLRADLQRRRPQTEPNSYNSSKESTFLRLVYTIINFINRQLWHRIYWPDTACLWFFPAIRKARQLLKEGHYCTLITVSPPFTSVLVGYKLQKHFKNLLWLIDLGDPFCFLKEASCNNFYLYERLNYWFEKKAFDLAKAITVTTKSTAEKYAELFHDNKDKIKVIPPLLSISEAKPNGNRVFSWSDKIRLVFVGTLYKTIREPNYLLSLFQKALETHTGPELELHFFGDVSTCMKSFALYENLLNSKVFLHGVVPRNTVTRAMCEADILVNIGNDTLYQLPSKVVEYAACGRPIINIAKSEQDSSMGFFRGYPYKLFLIHKREVPDQTQLAEFNQFLKIAKVQINRHVIQNWVAPHHIDMVSAEYMRLITACHSK